METLTHTFQIGNFVSFNRNTAVNSESTSIISLVETMIEQKQEDLTYIIEHSSGWTPNSLRMQKYNLDENKKYLFVQEKELTLI